MQALALDSEPLLPRLPKHLDRRSPSRSVEDVSATTRKAYSVCTGLKLASHGTRYQRFSPAPTEQSRKESYPAKICCLRKPLSRYEGRIRRPLCKRIPCPSWVVCMRAYVPDAERSNTITWTCRFSRQKISGA